MRRRAVVIGTGGHCRAVLSLLYAMKQHSSLQLVELGELRRNEKIMGINVSLTAADLSGFSGRLDVDVYLAVGDNISRQKWWLRAKELGLALPNLISPLAIVDNAAILGDGNLICPRAFIGPETVMGDNNIVNTAALLEHEVCVGDHNHFAPSSTVAGRCGFGDSCFLGAGAIVIDGLSVADRTTIGAGATVIKSIEQEDGVYVGVPAKRQESKI
ncbi:NeuD/PglB/VioB family sugar acetyltransferase [Pseudomonadales bacterium]|nr:NeuD/PglB/VioB family sugar acetyltransferase [Pseudomonadales bacterium]